MAEYVERVQEVADRVLRLVAQGLGMEDTGVFSRMVRRDGSDELLRVNHYPPALRAQAGGGAAATGFGEHTDPQIISVLRSNAVPGLQIALPDGRWLPVQPNAEELFVIVGDAMQVKSRAILGLFLEQSIGRHMYICERFHHGALLHAGDDQWEVQEREAQGGCVGGREADAAGHDILRRAGAVGDHRARGRADEGRGGEALPELHVGRVQGGRLQD